jgi:carbonic anhydrase
MSDLRELLANNRAWSEGIKAEDPDFFETLARQQTPRYLWIGCSDSRVPATQLVGLLPGDMFVHRNVANVVVHTDFNCLSVLQFAVDVLKVEHVIVCGHYGCGGVQAAMRNLRLGLIDNWLRHVQDVMHGHAAQLSSIEDEAARLDRLCELNVIEQVVNVSRTTIVQKAWERGQELAVHGCVYGIGDGLLRDLSIQVTKQGELSSAYEEAVRALDLAPQPRE